MLLSGSLASCSLGWIETRLVGSSFGIGMNVHKDFGVIVACSTQEGWLTAWSGDVVYSIGVHALSPYLYFSKGIYSDKSMRKPALFFYFGGHYWRWPNENYVYSLKRYYQAGVGVKWSFYAYSPAFVIGFQKS